MLGVCSGYTICKFASKANSVFTLTGVKVSSHAGMLNLRSLPKGIYVVNGKKELVK